MNTAFFCRGCLLGARRAVGFVFLLNSGISSSTFLVEFEVAAVSGLFRDVWVWMDFREFFAGRHGLR